MKKLTIIIWIIFAALPSVAQDNKVNVWKTLEDVTYKITKDEYGDVYVPVFGEEIQKMEGKEVMVDGFIIPFEGMFKPTQLILSSLPISECFFCGSGGPETVMEIYLKEKMKYTSKRVRIKGTLKLNDEDPDKLMYILEEGEYVGIAEGI